ncbi:tetratricopeptide repeat protein [Persicimonas caeni]|nr:tetratricopeptide repeat protein [Persicimonas caeni]
MEDKCGVKLTRMTGEAACRAGDGLGCTTAAVLSLSSVGLSKAISQQALASNNDHAYRLAKQGCDFGNETSCLLQAQMMLQSSSQQEQARGFRLMDRSCKAGMGSICHTLGTIFEEYATAPREKQDAFDYYRRSCAADYAEGCFRLGKMWETGFGTSTNLSKSKEKLHAACDLNHAKACASVDREPPKDDEELLAEWAAITNQSFIDMALAGCKNGFKHGCTFAGRLIERGEIRGRYVGDEHAVALFRAGCAQGSPESCYHLAQKTFRGEGLEANTVTASKLAHKGCKAGSNDACDLYRDLKYRLFEPKEASKYADHCEDDKKQERGYACYLSAKAYGYGVNFDADEERALELHEKGCALDYADSCEAAGDLLVESDEKRALGMYRKGCDGGADKACHVLGSRYAKGDGVEKDVTRAVDYLEKACTRGLGDACGELGDFYADGEGADKDEARAEQMFRNGCANGHIRSCTRLAQFYLRANSEESFRQAIQLYEFACTNEEPEACDDLGSIHASLDDEESHIEAADYFEKACLMDFGRGCSNFASRYYFGVGVEKDREKAVELYRRSCTQGFETGCYRLASIYEAGEDVDRDAKKALELYEAACKDEHVDSCRSVARMKLNGTQTAYQPEVAKKYLTKACNLGSDAACIDVANLVTRGVHVEQSLEDAVGFLSTGCEADGATSCSKLADRLRLGMGAPADPKQASTKAKRSLDIVRNNCEDGVYGHCDWAAHLIAHGDGDRTDFSAAREYLRKKCDEDIASACIEIGEQKSTGELFPRDRQKGVDKLVALCKDSDLETACYEAAYFMRFGHSDELDLTRSVDLYQSLCDDDNPVACRAVGTAYLHGLGVDRDYTRAVNTLADTCTADESTGCLSYLAALMMRGDSAKAKPLAQRSKSACERNNATGCIQQGELLSHGVAVGRDLTKAIEMFERACEMGEFNSCARAEALRDHQTRLEKADAEALIEQCEQKDDATACVVLGLANEYGIGAKASFDAAATRYEQACEADEKLGCQLRVAMDLHSKKPLTGDAVYDLSKKACALGSGEYCYGRGVGLSNHDWDAGVEMVGRACGEGVERACLWMTANGESVGE